MTINWYTPRCIIKNISHKDVRVLLGYTLKAGHTVDLYTVFEPNQLSDFVIIKALEKPEGDLYREVEIKRTLEIVDINLVAWNYSIVQSSNLLTTNIGIPGQILSLDNNKALEWIDASGFAASHPLDFTGGILSIPPADGAHDGYLTKEDWTKFSTGTGTNKPAQKIWEYQDFSAPVASTLTLNSFQNGTGLIFDASYIQDATAVIVLLTDSSSPPTSTLSIPAKYLPSNRVKVSSHIGTTVILNQTPEATLNCRVFYLIDLPANKSYPTDYQEDPEFSNPASNDFNDANYVNQNQDEGVFGVKTFDSKTIFTNSIQIPLGASDTYVLTSDASGNGSWAPSGGGGSGITAAQHKSLRQLIHLANNGPYEGFASGAFRETNPNGDPFPTNIIWYEDSGKTKKIVEKTIQYGSTKATISSIIYKVYDVDGSTILATVTDNVVYNNMFEVSRIRTIV